MLMVNTQLSAKPLVELEGVSKCYRHYQALHKLDLSVEQGECLALIGHNGAGKTTLLKLLLGLVRTDTGNIKLFDETPSSKNFARHRRLLGFLPEAAAFKRNLNALETLQFYGALKNVDSSEIHSLLELVDLAGESGKKVSNFSKGMRQRLSLAQSLLGNPQLLILDEPTSGMDPTFRRRFYEIIRQRQQAGVTILLSSHSLKEIEQLTDHVAILHEGKLICKDNIMSLRQQSALPLCIDISLVEQDDGLLAFLQKSGISHSLSMDEHLLLECEQDKKVMLIEEITSRARGKVRDIQIREPGLEDIFLHYINKAGHR